MVKVNYRIKLNTGTKQKKRTARQQVDTIRKRVSKKGKKWDSVKIIRAIRDGK